MNLVGAKTFAFGVECFVRGEGGGGLKSNFLVPTLLCKNSHIFMGNSVPLRNFSLAVFCRSRKKGGNTVY